MSMVLQKEALKSSRMLGDDFELEYDVGDRLNFRKKLVENTSLNWHSNGVTWKSTDKTTFEKYWNVVGTTKDPRGREFFALLEGKPPTASHHGYNFYASQFHPEKPPFEFDRKTIGHDMGSIEVSQYLSRFINLALRRSTAHHFKSTTAAEQALIQQKTAAYIDYGVGMRVYWFVKSKADFTTRRVVTMWLSLGLTFVLVVLVILIGGCVGLRPADQNIEEEEGDEVIECRRTNDSSTMNAAAASDPGTAPRPAQPADTPKASYAPA